MRYCQNVLYKHWIQKLILRPWNKQKIYYFLTKNILDIIFEFLAEFWVKFWCNTKKWPKNYGFQTLKSKLTSHPKIPIYVVKSNSKLIFEFNVDQGLFGMYQGFKKATPYGRAWKLRLTRPLAPCETLSKFPTWKWSRQGDYRVQSHLSESHVLYSCCQYSGRGQ